MATELSKKKEFVLDALRECILAIKSVHSYDYCPTCECQACTARWKAENALKSLLGG